METTKTIPITAVQPELPGGIDACASAEPFALMVLGDSMMPEFEERDIVIVEPDGLADDGAFVLAHVQDEWYLRRLARAAAGWQLQPLNPSYRAIDLPDLGAVRGVIVQRAQPGQRRELKRYVD